MKKSSFDQGDNRKKDRSSLPAALLKVYIKPSMLKRGIQSKFKPSLTVEKRERFFNSQ